MYWESEGNQYFIRFESGEPLLKVLNEFVISQRIEFGFFEGIGGLRKVKFGVYNDKTKTYDKHSFSDFCEVVALNGNISLHEGTPFLHVHFLGASGANQFLAGHLFEAEVAITIEMKISVSSLQVTRKYEEIEGFKVLQLKNRFICVPDF
ncbi:MAG TPA: hypothetical protein DCL41_08065 [Bdellovibrionales bacterium]|nr:hypothetical protein [Pseudobdellovibrionaceae bacterium]HAG91812.1 hypothetical protein [Bdellovibrionales bacterium]|tara:strand:- start:1045 stop:1494 length:450 start_codon:yes stop_codon:yes gene_type:complete